MIVYRKAVDGVAADHPTETLNAVGASWNRVLDGGDRAAVITESGGAVAAHRASMPADRRSAVANSRS